MAEVEYDLYGKPLCFFHAVKAVMEKNEKVSASVPDDINSYDMGGTGYLGASCCECFPPEEGMGDEEEDEEDEI